MFVKKICFFELAEIVQIADNILFPIKQGGEKLNRKETRRIFSQESIQETITKKMYLQKRLLRLSFKIKYLST